MPQIKRSQEDIAKDIAQQHKTCSVCEVRKHFDYFYNYKNKSDGKGYRCKDCDDKAKKKWIEENPYKAYESVRRNNLRKYGISLEQYLELLEEQQGGCALCGIKENNTIGNRKDWNFSVDHDHTSGKVRGLLCNNCNRGLGLLKDNPELLRKAANYVERHRECH